MRLVDNKVNNVRDNASTDCLPHFRNAHTLHPGGALDPCTSLINSQTVERSAVRRRYRWRWGRWRVEGGGLRCMSDQQREVNEQYDTNKELVGAEM